MRSRSTCCLRTFVLGVWTNVSISCCSNFWENWSFTLATDSSCSSAFDHEKAESTRQTHSLLLRRYLNWIAELIVRCKSSTLVFEIVYHDICSRIPLSFRLGRVRSIRFFLLHLLGRGKTKCSNGDLFCEIHHLLRIRKTFLVIFSLGPIDAVANVLRWCDLQILLNWFDKLPVCSESFRVSAMLWILGNIPLELNGFSIDPKWFSVFVGLLGVLKLIFPLQCFLNARAPFPDKELNLS